MKLASYLRQGHESFGAVLDGGLLDLAGRLGPQVGSLVDLLSEARLAQVRELAAGAAPDLALDDVTLLPPVVRPGKTVCVGVNYRSRPEEYGRASEPPYPSLFFRNAAAQVGHLQPLRRPPESVQFDYEGEIALVIGRGGRRIAERDALAHIGGYACFNDGSVRDWMKHGVFNVTAGKNFDASGAFGPWLATPDEVGDPGTMRIRTRVNGDTVQDDTTANLIAPFQRLIAYISTFMTLEPGDVISTGTPAGVGGKKEPPVWLKPGDVVDVEVAGVGVLRNPVADEET